MCFIVTVSFVGDYDPQRRQVTDIAIKDGKLVLTLMPYDEGGTFGEPEEMSEQQLIDEISVEELEALVDTLV